MTNAAFCGAAAENRPGVWIIRGSHRRKTEREDIEALFQSPYWVIDILPEQVPEDCGGQYFTIEEYWLQKPQRTELVKKHLQVLLKLNCYYDIHIWEGETNPAPETLAALMRRERLNLLLDNALIVTDPDDTYMTVYNADSRLLALIRPIAAAEGLFVWQPE